MSTSLSDVMKNLRLRPSSFRRVKLCPGSLFAVARAMADKTVPQADTRAADAGSMIHAEIADALFHLTIDKIPTDVPGYLASEQYAKLSFAARICVKAVSEYLTDDDVMLFVEEPFAWGMVLGTPDAVVVNTKTQTVTILDWKTGLCGARPAEANEQTMLYATMVHERFGDSFQYAVRLVCPCATEETTRDTSAIVCAEDFARMKVIVGRVWAAASAENAPRIPYYETCEYCPAKCTKYCPESLPTPAFSVDEGHLPELTNETLANAFIAATAASKCLDAIRGEIVQRAEAGTWPASCNKVTVSKPTKTTRVSDVCKAWDILREHIPGCEPQLRACITGLTVGKLQELYEDHCRKNVLLLKNLSATDMARLLSPAAIAADFKELLKDALSETSFRRVVVSK